MTSHVHRLLDRVAAAGGSVAVDGENLELSAPAPLPVELVDELRQSKIDLIRHLRGDDWGATDWWVFREERIAIAMHDGEMPEPNAQRQARDECITHWLHRNPPKPIDPDVCVGCGHPIGTPGNDGVPFLAGEHGHVWIHHCCHRPWMARRREEATAELNTFFKLEN